MSSKKNYTISNFYCVECGRHGLDICRKNGQQREAGHLKRLYCIYCQREVNHAEIKPFGSSYTKEDFDLEFETGRFVNEQRIPVKDLPPCKNDCQCNVNGRCWNSKGDVREFCGYNEIHNLISKKPDLVYCSDGSVKEEYR